MPVPVPTPILRLIHVDNLPICLRRGGIHASNFTHQDGLVYKPIHNTDIQNQRRVRPVRCGPGGVIHDYVPFYFGFLSPMLLQLKTGQVSGYTEGQRPLIYLVSSAQAVRDAGRGFVFSDGHCIAAFTHWFDDLASLDQVDWNMVYERYWADNINDMDRQRRKQAEFLVHQFCDWSLIHEITVVGHSVKTAVEQILNQSPSQHQPPVVVRSGWYY
jgi:hypothetical protein